MYSTYNIIVGHFMILTVIVGQRVKTYFQVAAQRRLSDSAVDAFLRSIRDTTATAQVGEEFEALKLTLELVVTQLQH